MGSLNYAWFNAKYDGFIYVDAVATESSSTKALALPCTTTYSTNTTFQSPQK